MPKDLNALKIALVHDDLTQYGGGERIFLAIKDLFPKAAIYTSMATPEWVERLGGRRPHVSFMQKLPLKKKLERAVFPLYPLAFESFDFSEYDLVISSSSRFAHGIITRPETIHICYMHSPGRMFWEAEGYFGSKASKASFGKAGASFGSKASKASSGKAGASFGSNPRLRSFLSPTLSYLRLWDRAAAQRVDHFIANSRNTAERIAKYYGREADVVYPFVDLGRFTSQVVNSESSIVNGNNETINHKPLTTDFFLIVTRLVSWKRVDIAVKAINRLNTRMGKGPNNSNVRLVVVGDGPDRKRLEALVNGKQSLFSRKLKNKSSMVNGEIEFLGRVSDEELVKLYHSCRALIMTQQEDFGITPLEAQAAGKPVIAYGAGGALETIVPKKTGEFFDEQTSEALEEVLKDFDPQRYSRLACRRQAKKFSREAFERNFKAQIERLVGR